jgi:hypothetical protein
MNAYTPTYAPGHVTSLKRTIAECSEEGGMTLMELSKNSGMRIIDCANVLEKSPDDFHSERNADNVILWTLNR